MSFTVLDIIFCVLIIIFALVATANGFVKSIFGKLSWIVGLIVAFMFYGKLDDMLKKSAIKNPTLSAILSFVLIFVVVFLIVKIIENLFRRLFSGEIMKGLDRALGFIFGVVEGLAVVFLIIFLLKSQPWFDVSEILEGGFFYKTFAGYLPAAQSLLPKESA